MPSSDQMDGTTLQLLSHLEGDALNVALLVTETWRATHVGLVGALTAHYDNPPGRLADYRWQFEKTTRLPEEAPSIFAIALGDISSKGIWRYGSQGATLYHTGLLYSRS